MRFNERNGRGIVMSRPAGVWEYREWEKHAFGVLCDYRRMLLEWRERYPERDRHYVESLCAFSYCEFVFDRFIRGGRAERINLRKAVEGFEERICEYRRECISCVAYGKGKDKRVAVLG